MGRAGANATLNTNQGPNKLNEKCKILNWYIIFYDLLIHIIITFQNYKAFSQQTEIKQTQIIHYFLLNINQMKQESFISKKFIIKILQKPTYNNLNAYISHTLDGLLNLKLPCSEIWNIFDYTIKTAINLFVPTS